MKKICMAVLFIFILIFSSAFLKQARADEYDWLTGLWEWKMFFNGKNVPDFTYTLMCTRSGIVIDCENKVMAVIQDGRLIWQFNDFGWKDTNASISSDRREITYPQNEAVVKMTRK